MQQTWVKFGIKVTLNSIHISVSFKVVRLALKLTIKCVAKAEHHVSLNEAKCLKHGICRVGVSAFERGEHPPVFHTQLPQVGDDHQ